MYISVEISEYFELQLFFHSFIDPVVRIET